MTVEELPPAMLPPACDLRDFPYMPLHVARVRDAETTVRTNGDEFRCAVLLWCVSWHQIPAGSLPDDDVLLADFAGFGRVVKEWKRMRAGALRGFVKCADGRLYHPVVTQVAIGAWRSRLESRWERDCGKMKKHAERAKKPFERPTFGQWLYVNCPEAGPYMSPGQEPNVPGTDLSCPEDSGPVSLGQPPLVPGFSTTTEGKVRYTTSKTLTSTASKTPGGNGRKSTPDGKIHGNTASMVSVGEAIRAGLTSEQRAMIERNGSKQ